MQMFEWHYDPREERIFLIAYTLWLTNAVIGITMWRKFDMLDTVGNYMQKVSYMLLVIQFFVKKRYTKKDVAGVFLILLAAIISYHSVHNKPLLSLAILVYFSANVDYKKILKVTLVVQGIFFVISVLSSQLSVIEDVLWRRENGEIRQSLGYDFCAYPAHIMLFMTLYWFCIREKVTAIEIIFFGGINTALFLVTDSKADYMLCILALAGFCWIGREKYALALKRHFVLDFLMKYGAGIIGVFSIALHYFYQDGNAVWVKLDNLLTNRLRYGKMAIQEYGFSLFGKVIKWYGQGGVRNNPLREYNYVDCAYLKTLLESGIIALTILIIAFYLVGKILVMQRNYFTGWAVIILLLYGIANAHLTRVAYNSIILVLGYALHNEYIYIEAQENQVTDRRMITILTEKISIKGSDFLNQLGAVVKPWCKYKSTLRISMFCILFVTLTYVQVKGVSGSSDKASFFISCIGMMILVIAGFTWGKKRNDNNIENKTLKHFLMIYIALVMVSDFFVSKRYNYTGFSMFLFGGLFYLAWESMDCPNELIDDFIKAYKMYFALTVIFCLAARPITPGICYNGIFTKAEDNALMILAAFLIFVRELINQKRKIINSLGLLLALYLLYRTCQPVALLLAIVDCLLVFFFTIIYERTAFWTWKNILTIGIGVIAGCFLIAVVDRILYVEGYKYGLQLVYERDVLQEIVFWGKDFFNVSLWYNFFADQIRVWGIYLSRWNLIGHKYLLKVDKAYCWPGNNIILNLYWYGLPAALAYAVVVLLYIKKIFADLLQKRYFFAGLIAANMIVCNMAMPVSIPFLHLGWVLLFFSFLSNIIVT